MRARMVASRQNEAAPACANRGELLSRLFALGTYIPFKNDTGLCPAHRRLTDTLRPNPAHLGSQWGNRVLSLHTFQ
jgi:hypothetical protein